MNTNDRIFKCARRMIHKMGESNYYKMDGCFPPGVQLEIDRIKSIFETTTSPSKKEDL